MPPTLSDLDLDCLRRSLALAAAARARGDHPFGAILVGPAGYPLAEGQNTVVSEDDCTGHAELNLIRRACLELDPSTRNQSTLYSSAEPCPMCSAALHWAGIGRVVFALAQERLYELMGERSAAEALRLNCRQVLASSGREIEVSGPALGSEAEQVHRGFWGDDR